MKKFKITEEKTFEEINIELNYKPDTAGRVCVPLAMVDVLHSLLLDLQISHKIHHGDSDAAFDIEAPKIEYRYRNITIYICTGVEYSAKELKDSNSK